MIMTTSTTGQFFQSL